MRQVSSNFSYQNNFLRCCSLTDICTYIKDHVTIFICYYYLFMQRHDSPMPFKQTAAYFFFKHLCNQRQSSLGALFSSWGKKKEKWQGKASLWNAIVAVNNLRQDSKFDPIVLRLHWPHHCRFYRRRPSVTSALISVFIFVTWAPCKWDLSRLSVHDPCPNEEQLIPGRSCCRGSGGHGDHLETRCSAVCQHHLSDLTHCRVRLCTLAWTGMCQERQQCTKTHAHV